MLKKLLAIFFCLYVGVSFAKTNYTQEIGERVYAIKLCRIHHNIFPSILLRLIWVGGEPGFLGVVVGWVKGSCFLLRLGVQDNSWTPSAGGRK